MPYVPPDSQAAPPEADKAPRNDPPSDVHVRGRCANGVCTAIASDAKSIAWTQAYSWQVAYEQRFVPTARPARDFEADVGRWARRIAVGSLPVLVALRARAVVGYVAMAEPPRQGDVRTAYVESAHLQPPHWRDRVGESLVLGAADMLGQRGFDALAISVLTDNTKVQWFLVEHGFQLTGGSMRRGRMHTLYTLPLRRPG